MILWENVNLDSLNFNIGFGCMLSWFIILRYFLKTLRFSSMMESFILAIPPISKALISVLPLFFGYTLLGMSIFWESMRFRNLSSSAFTLLAVMCGDMICETWIDILQIDRSLTYVYLYSFSFMAVAVVSNIFTIIIEEGFMRQKYEHDFNWLSKNQRQHFTD